MNRLLYRLSEAGDLLGGASESKVRVWVQEGRLGAVRVDGVLRIPATAICEFVAALSPCEAE